MQPAQHSYIGENERKRSFNWGYLLVGILFVAAGILALVNPVGNLEALAVAFAFLAVINGIWLLVNSRGSVWRVIGGVLDILIGVFFFANIYLAMAALPYIFAVWFIVDSLVRLATIGITRLLGTGYFVLSLILNILGVIVGVMLLFSPITSALTLSFWVGFYLLLAGVQALSLSFSR